MCYPGIVYLIVIHGIRTKRILLSNIHQLHMSTICSKDNEVACIQFCIRLQENKIILFGTL